MGAWVHGRARLVGIDADCKGIVKGKLFTLFAKVGQNRADLQSMGKNTISAGFLVLSLGDVVALSQFPLSLWEAVAFGVLCVTSYGLGLWTAFAE